MSEKITRDTLVGGVEFPHKVYKHDFSTGKFSRGEIVGFDNVTKKIVKCSDVTKVYGIVAENIELTQAGKGTVYVSGIFNYNALKNGTAFDKELLRVELRKLNMYIEN